MGTPPAPEILVNGRPAYYDPYTGRYTPNRAYAMRLQRAFARGETRQEARGHRTPEGVTEAALRRQRFQERYGFSLNEWNRWRRAYIDWINEHRVAGSNIDTIKPSHITDIIQLYNMGAVDVTVAPDWRSWVEYRLGELYADLEEYEAGDAQPGRVHFYTRPPYAPIEFWWYH